MKIFCSFILTLFTVNVVAQLNYISPNSGLQGESLNVTISGSNIDFSQYYDDYSGMGWYDYSSFQLVYGDYSYPNTIFGNIYEDNGNSANASVYIPNNAPTGYYDVKVYDLMSLDWVVLEDGFYVDNQTNFGQYLDINNNLIDFDIISQEQDILFYFSCFSFAFDIPEYEEYLEQIFNDFGCNNEDVFVVIIGSFECSPGLDFFIEQYDVDIPIINLLHVEDYIEEYFNIDGAPFIYLNNNQNSLQRSYVDIYEALLNIGASFIPCSDTNYFSPLIEELTPDNGIQGESLNVTISGSNIDFSQYYEDFSGTSWYEYSQIELVFEDYSNSFTILGEIHSDYGDQASATLYIPDIAPIGNYDVHVLEHESSSWIVLEDGFYVGENSSMGNESFCSSLNAFYCEDFESIVAPSLPFNISTSSNEDNYFINDDLNAVEVSGFYTGTSEDAGLGGYWTYIDEHTTFAMTNDDACMPSGGQSSGSNNCDLSFEALELPEFNFTEEYNLYLSFDYFHDKNWGGGDAYVEISIDGGASWNSISGPLNEAQNWQNSYVDLSSYNNFTSVKIRFVWSDNGSWASGFAIDNIVINQLDDFAYNMSVDVTLPSSYFENSAYSMVPLSQAQSAGLIFSGYVENTGLNIIEDAYFNFSVFQDGYFSQSDTTNIASFESNTLMANDVYIPSNIGVNDVQYYLSSSNGSQMPPEYTSFEISEFEYARDDAGMFGDYIGGHIVNDDGSEQIGNVYEIYEDAIIYSIKVRVHPNTTPNCMAKGIINFVDPGNPSSYYFMTETQEINIGGYTDGWTNLILQDPIEVYAGDIILPTISAYYNGVDTLVIGTSGSSNVGESMLQDIDGIQLNGNPGDWYYTTTTPMVRLNFDPSIESMCDYNYDFNIISYPSDFEGCDGIYELSNISLPDDAMIYVNGTSLDYQNQESILIENTCGPEPQISLYSNFCNPNEPLYESYLWIGDCNYVEHSYDFNFINYPSSYDECDGNIEISEISLPSNAYMLLNGEIIFEEAYSSSNSVLIENICFGDYHLEIVAENNCRTSEWYHPEIEPSIITSVESNNALQGETLEVTISGSNAQYQNCFNVASDTYCEYNNFNLFYSDQFSNTYYIYGNILEFEEDTAIVEISIPIEAPVGYYDVVIHENESLIDGFYVSQNLNPCVNWSLDINNDIFTVEDLNSNSNKMCAGTIEISAYHPYFSEEKLEWSNGASLSSLSLNSDASLSLIYYSDDTTCIVDHFQFDIIEEIQEIAQVNLTPNSCFGVDDGFVTIEGLNSFAENLMFSVDQDLMDFFNNFLSNSNSTEESIIVNNPNQISQLYVNHNNSEGIGCVLDVSFDSQLLQAEHYTLPFEENFDTGMPCDWNNDSFWSFGSASDLVGPYWNIPAHNQFAVSNDDVCDCDMMEDRLITPPLIIENFEDNIILSFSAFFTGDYSSIANVEISNDMGNSWQNISVLTLSSDWQDLSFDISDFINSETIQLAFRHSDSHSWGSGFAVDDIMVDFQCLDSDNDGVCDDDEVIGCTNALANNFNELANLDDGSCEYADSEDPCDIIPTGLYVDDIIHNRVVFNWSTPSAAPSHYMIRYREVGSSSWTVMTAGPVNSNEFTGTSRTRYFMEPGTTYEWGIRARVLNEDGSTNCQSSWSSNSEYTTLDACANLGNLSYSTEANWVTLSADAPSEEWGVWQSKAKMRVVGTNSYRYANGDSNGNISVLKGNFTASTDYEWHTKAWCTGNVDANGDSDPQYHSGWGEFSTFSTQDPCDKMPTNLSTSSNGASTAITMSWETPESGAPDHYFLQLTNLTTGQVWEWNNLAGLSTSKTKFGLTAGDYSWRIRGACGTNGTSWATIFSSSVEYTLGGARLENSSVANLDLYPNPSKGEFNISFELENRQDAYLTITNYLGEVVFTEELKDQKGEYNKTIDLGNESNGIYMLNITTKNQNINQKIVIQ